MKKKRHVAPTSGPTIRYDLPNELYNCIGTEQTVFQSPESQLEQNEEEVTRSTEPRTDETDANGVVGTPNTAINAPSTPIRKSSSAESKLSALQLIETSPQPAYAGGLGSSASYDHFDDEQSWKEDTHLENRERPSNERLLWTAFSTFFGFALLQTGAAIYAGSEAMMGDSAAMMVDALTYLFNLLAECQKNRYNAEMFVIENSFRRGTRIRTSSENGNADGRDLNELHLQINTYKYRLKTLRLELVPPLISVTALVIVTIVVAHEAIQVLVSDLSHDANHIESDPNLHLMMIFSVLNLMLDCLNVFCFAKAEHAMGYSTTDITPSNGNENLTSEPHHRRRRPRSKRAIISQKNGNKTGQCIEHDATVTNMSLDGEQNRNADNGLRQLEIPFQDKNDDADPRAGTAALLPNGHAVNTPQTRKGLIPLEIESSSMQSEDDNAEHENSNLNMCSAYTHVFADTLRSAAVIIAAGIAEFVDAVSSELADAFAALFVSILIGLSLIPLLFGLVRTLISLRTTTVFHKRALRRLERLQQLGSDDVADEHDIDEEEEGLLQADYSDDGV